MVARQNFIISQVVKETILKNALTGDRTIKALCDEFGISTSTYYYWKSQERKKVRHPMSSKRPQDWTPAEKLNAIKATAALNAEETAAWCRENGIYAHHIEQWEQELITGASHTERKLSRKERHERNRMRARVKELEKELNRKDKALAETTALLVLKKKLEEYLGEGEE